MTSEDQEKRDVSDLPTVAVQTVVDQAMFYGVTFEAAARHLTGLLGYDGHDPTSCPVCAAIAADYEARLS